MSKLHVTQIEGQISKLLDSHIDMSDYANHNDKDTIRKAFLTRGLSVIAISKILGMPAEQISPYVTDGQDDGGIDLIYFDTKEKNLYLVQSKWHSSGHGSIDKGDALKFLDGVKHIVDLDMEGFNSKVRKLETDITNALYETNVNIILIIVHTGQEDLNDDVLKPLAEYVNSVNDTSEIMNYRIMKQKDIYQYIASGFSGDPIKIDIQFNEWGRMKEPNQAIYGQVCVTDVAHWLEQYGKQLFDENIRFFMGMTAPNNDIIKTLTSTPEKFWYYNNGITAIANSIQKKAIGGNTASIGTFECQGFCIVNGAQTVGSIHSAISRSKDIDFSKAMVTVRVIAIDGADKEFSSFVTRYTNTQNAIEKRDFVALDPEQERIRNELAIEGIDYLYKTGSKGDSKRPYFELADATLALACASPDVNMPVQAKREVGRLWENIEKAPYKNLFNASVFGPHLWTLVQLFRQIEHTLNLESKNLSKREGLICVHGNRFIQWATMQRLDHKQENAYEKLLPSIPELTINTMKEIINYTNEHLSDSYPASLFKSIGKCKLIAQGLAI